jgi:tetratricopeptide (TPR) repeat protein
MIFNKLFGRKKKPLSEEEIRKLQIKIHESTKDVLLDSQTIEENAQKYPDIHFQDVKTPKEFRARCDALHYSMIGEYEKSIECANKGLEENPESAYLFYMRGRTKGDTGLFDEGNQDLNVAIRIKPDFADAFVERGYIKEKMGDIDAAEEDYEKADSIEPDIFKFYPHLQEFRGRGIKLLFLVSPCPSESEQKEFQNIIKNSPFNVHFTPVNISFYSCEDNSMWLKIFCEQALFSVRSWRIKEVYQDIFDDSFAFVKSMVNNKGLKLKGYSFEFLYLIPIDSTQKEPEDIMPMPEPGYIIDYDYAVD